MKRILSAVALTLLLSVCVSAQEAQTSDDAAIRQIVQYYFDGSRNNDVSLLRKAIHPSAKWLALAQSNGNGLREIKVARTYVNIEGRNPINLMGRIVSIDVTGKAAIVKTEVEYPEGILNSSAPGVMDTEYLSLIKFGEGWRIVSKISFPKKTNLASPK
jgi:putative lumazine-binding protein